MTQKWFKAADVCEMAELQPYVLRSWEKEFPGIGVQKSTESPRLYRQSDVEQVLKITSIEFDTVVPSIFEPPAQIKALIK